MVAACADDEYDALAPVVVVVLDVMNPLLALFGIHDQPAPSWTCPTCGHVHAHAHALAQPRVDARPATMPVPPPVVVSGR